MNVRIKLGVVAASVAALALSACGSSSLSGEAGGGGSAPSVSVSQNADLASKLPESIKNAGVIKIGVDASYAPNEFLAGDGKTVQGMDVDLFNQVASKFGVKTEWHPADFGSIINGVNGKKYDMGISSFTINPERMKQVNMVSYFTRRHPVGDGARATPRASTLTMPAVRTSQSKATQPKKWTTFRCGRRSAAATRSTSCPSRTRAKPLPPSSAARQTPCWPTRRSSLMR